MYYKAIIKVVFIRKWCKRVNNLLISLFELWIHAKCGVFFFFVYCFHTFLQHNRSTDGLIKSDAHIWHNILCQYPFRACLLMF